MTGDTTRPATIYNHFIVMALHFGPARGLVAVLISRFTKAGPAPLTRLTGPRHAMSLT
jgi:hypothetical protein